MAATVSYRLNRPKNTDGTLKTKPVSILIRYYNSGIELEMSSGHKVVPELFTGTRVDKSVSRSSKINKSLSDKENQLLNLEFENLTQDQERQKAREIISKKEKEIASQPEPVQKKTTGEVIEAVQRFIAQYEREKEQGTVRRYKVVLGKLIKFNPELNFSDLDQNFYDKFKAFLYNQPNPVYSKYHLEYDRINGCFVMHPNSDTDTAVESIGLFDDTVFKYFINISSVCTWASKRGYKVNPAYKEWEIIKRTYPPISLTEDELNRLEEKAFNQRHLDIARDYLVLECRTGQRISDLRRFTVADLKDNTWHFTQKKGNRQKAKHIRLPLVGFSANALAILQKYNYVLPKMSEQKLNEHIKTVCQKVGIDQPIYIERYAGSKKVRIPGFKYEFLSSHSGKKTFITLLAQKGASIKSISDLTGTSIKTIERHYLGEMDTKSLADVLEKAGGQKATMRIAN